MMLRICIVAPSVRLSTVRHLFVFSLGIRRRWIRRPGGHATGCAPFTLIPDRTSVKPNSQTDALCESNISGLFHVSAAVYQGRRRSASARQVAVAISTDVRIRTTVGESV